MQPGLTFGLQNGTAVGTNGVSGLGTQLASLKSIATAFGTPLTSIMNQNSIQATVNMFVSDKGTQTYQQNVNNVTSWRLLGKLGVVSSPSAANDREVAFSATQQIPYVSGSSVAGSQVGNYGSSYNNTAFVNVGTTINILPRIQSGHRLKLGASLAISQLDQFITISSGSSGSAPQQVPQTSGRKDF